MQLAESSLWAERRSRAGMRGSTWAPAQTVGEAEIRGRGKMAAEREMLLTPTLSSREKAKCPRFFFCFFGSIYLLF